MGKPALHYTLHVSLPDDTDRITITSPEVPGLLIWAPPQEAFADVHESVKKLRLLNARAEKETFPSPAPSGHGGVNYERLAEMTNPPEVPEGHFWRGDDFPTQCRNCGQHYDKHLHTDEASRCPPAETAPAPEESILKAFDRSPRRVPETPAAPKCDCEGPQKVGADWHAPYCSTVPGGKELREKLERDALNR